MPNNKDTFKYSGQIGSSYSVNQDLAKAGLSPADHISDNTFHSVGLYSKEEIEEAKFNKFSRFGRILDPYGRVNPGREFLFFVKPDLHICVPQGLTADGNSPDGVYAISGIANGELLYKNNNLTLNPQLIRNLYFKDLIDRNPKIIKEIQYGVEKNNNPFSHLLSFAVNSNLPLDNSSAKTMDNPSTIYGTSYHYLQDSEASDESYTFSLEFIDDKDLNVYSFFKAYSEYHIARKSGLVTPPSLDYYKYKRTHNTMGIYKFIVAEDMETVLYWAYLWGVIPTNCPRNAFSDANFTEGLTFSVDFEAAFIEDMNPIILYNFNKLMLKNHPNVVRSEYLPTVINNISYGVLPTSQNREGQLASKSYYTQDLNGKEIFGTGYSTFINGKLPNMALVDGQQLENESKIRYRLRWYDA